MISKLKKKFIFINMICVTVILVTAFGTVLAFSFARLEKDSRMALNTSADRNNRMGDSNKPAVEIGIPPGNEKKPGNFTIFTVRLDEKNQMKQLIGDDVEVSKEMLEEIVAACVEKEEKTGVLWDVSLRYLMNHNPEGNEIIFYDLSNEISSMIHLVKNCLFVGIASFLAFLLISIYLANWALKPVASAWESQRQFIADASHELKTPLTVILANADILSAHKEDTIANQYKWIEYVKAEASHMSGLVNDLLFLAKSDDAREKTVLTQINLSDILWNCYLPFESLAFEQQKNLEADITSNIKILGDAGKLKQLVMILLDNAFKYTEQNGSIKVRLYQKIEKNKIYLTVSNSGKAISQEHINHIFERFYRVEASRARQKGGYGLGLSIAKTIVQMHKGKIGVTSNEEGTIFWVTFHTGM